jgi:AcrR family transcriptional regulator
MRASVTQDERSERSRAIILDAARELFSHQGFRATSIRDIASKAGVSTGSVYHHFNDKEELFDTLLQQFRAIAESPDFPLFKVMELGGFPDRLEEIADAARDVVTKWRSSIALIYVDVIEFEGSHIRAFYTNMATVCDRFIAEHQAGREIPDRLRPGVPASAAMLITFRIFLYYFIVEVLFGVPNHYGMSSSQATAVISDILSHGMSRVPAAHDAGSR